MADFMFLLGASNTPVENTGQSPPNACGSRVRPSLFFSRFF